MNKLEALKQEYMKDVASFHVGDEINVYVKIIEGDRERTQIFSGHVISRNGKGMQETFTVRRISFGEGVERCFLLHSPRIEKIEVKKQGNVRRAKLYYLREKIGKDAKIKELEKTEV